MEFKDLFENWIGSKIKVLSIDNGSYFCSIEFDK
jgi:hypothetical protein